MTENDFYRTLWEAGFASWYYDLCSRHPPRPASGSPQKGTRAEVLALFAEAHQAVRYDGKWRHHELEFPSGGNAQCTASLFFQRQGIELTFSAQSGDFKRGTNLAVLAHDTVRMYCPESIPNPPFPRPDHAGVLQELGAIINGFSTMTKKLCVEFEKLA